MLVPIKPKFFARAQVNGGLKAVCVYCGAINAFSWKPTRNRMKCRVCEKQAIYSVAVHIPAAGTGRMPQDITIPSWADDEYLWDAIPPAVFDPKPLKAGQRMHLIVLHEGVWYTKEPLPENRE